MMECDTVRYMMECDTVHGKYDGTIVADGDSLVIDGQRMILSHTCDSADIPFATNAAHYVYDSADVFLTTEKLQVH